MTAGSYHHGNLREALVAAAVDAARAGGPDGIALRELARTVGVSHSAAYRHFAQRDELVEAVAVEGMAGLVRAMQDRLDVVERHGTDDPVLRARRRLVAVGQGYVEFAIAEPGLFRTAFSVTASQGDHGVPDLVIDPDVDPYGMLSEALDGLADVGYLSASARVGAEMLCWSAVHGFAALHLDGPLGVVDAAAREAALDQVFVAIDRSYAASSGTPIGPDDDIFARVTP